MTFLNEENMNIICQNNTNDSFNRLGFISKNLDKDADPNTSPFSLLIGLDDANNATVWNEQDGYIRFGTNNEERLRIFNNGDISCVNSHVELKHLTVHGDLNMTNTTLGQTTRIDGGGDAAKIVAMNTDSLTFNIDDGGGDVKFIEMNHNLPQKIKLLLLFLILAREEKVYQIMKILNLGLELVFILMQQENLGLKIIKCTITSQKNCQI